MYVACSTSGSSVPLSDVSCFSISPNYGAMARLSQSDLSWQRPWRICLSVRITGTRYPRGLYTELTVDKIPCRAKGLSCRTIRNWKVSDFIHHWMPSARSIGRTSFWRSRSLTLFALSSGTIFAITSLELEVKLWSRIPPLVQIHLVFSINDVGLETVATN